MRESMKHGVIALVAVMIPLLANPVWAQSVAVGSSSIEITDASSDNIFQVSSTQVSVGESGGPNVDLRIKDPFASSNRSALWFDASQSYLALGWGSGGEPGDDGDIVIYDNAGVQTIVVDGDSGDARQSSSGEGFVKAWVRVLGVDGSIVSSYNVTGVAWDAGSPGVYHVTFSNSAFESRPMTATLDGHNATPSTGGISLGLRDDFHVSGIQVLTYSASGTPANRSFNLVVY